MDQHTFYKEVQADHELNHLLLLRLAVVHLGKLVDFEDLSR